MKVTDILIYPIKSLGAISVDSCLAQKEGFEYDRRWMLVDEQGKFLTQREHSVMAKFSCALESGCIMVRYLEEEIVIPLSQYEDQMKKVKVWDSSLQANEVNRQVSEWFSEHLKIKSTLVRMTPASSRTKTFLSPPFRTKVSLADGYPYLILGSESMNLLNSKLSVPIPSNRFRANILVSTSIAHEEDEWNKNFSIGDVKMKVVKPCARCVVTTIDQRSGKKGKEPLKTLTKYRKWDNKIWFGANAICIQEGLISIGDKIVLT